MEKEKNNKKQPQSFSRYSNDKMSPGELNVREIDKSDSSKLKHTDNIGIRTTRSGRVIASVISYAEFNSSDTDEVDDQRQSNRDERQKRVDIPLNTVRSTQSKEEVKQKIENNSEMTRTLRPRNSQYNSSDLRNRPNPRPVINTSSRDIRQRNQPSTSHRPQYHSGYESSEGEAQDELYGLPTNSERSSSRNRRSLRSSKRMKFDKNIDIPPVVQQGYMSTRASRRRSPRRNGEQESSVYRGTIHQRADSKREYPISDDDESEKLEQSPAQELNSFNGATPSDITESTGYTLRPRGSTITTTNDWEKKKSIEEIRPRDINDGLHQFESPRYYHLRERKGVDYKPYYLQDKKLLDRAHIEEQRFGKSSRRDRENRERSMRGNGDKYQYLRRQNLVSPDAKTRHNDSVS